MIRQCVESDLPVIYSIVNDAAVADGKWFKAR